VKDAELFAQIAAAPDSVAACGDRIVTQHALDGLADHRDARVTG